MDDNRANNTNNKRVGDEEILREDGGVAKKKAKKRDEIDLTAESDGSDSEYESAEDSEGSLREFIVSGDEESGDSDMSDSESGSGEDEDEEEEEEEEYSGESESDDDEMASVTSSMCELDSDGEIVDVEYVPRVGPRSRSNGVTKRVTRSVSQQSKK